MRRSSAVLILMAAAAVQSCGDKVPDREVRASREGARPMASTKESPASRPPQGVRTETATLGGGCFWCLEAVYQELKGVTSVVSGYSGGRTENPTYEDVCTGTTGHAEVCQITFDPSVISYQDVLEVFWKVHDPTTLNRQGNDVGTQYRSVIFTHSDAQRALAERLRKELDGSGAWSRPLVTEITPFSKFWRAEDYHQNYFRTHPTQGYCAFIIAPKMDKFRKVFAEKLKP